jgi:adenylylsulfate reductase, subunit A
MRAESDMADFQTIVVETDVLILGGGMAACGAAVEAAWWARQQGLRNATTDPEVNPHYIKPRMFLLRLQKIMDEYAGGISAQFTTNEAFLKEDSARLAAADLHELMRCWENVHRMWQAEAHVRTVLYRQETRWPGYYFRADQPRLDEENWHVFANCRFDPKSNEWELRSRPVLHVFSSQPKEAGKGAA